MIAPPRFAALSPTPVVALICACLVGCAAEQPQSASLDSQSEQAQVQNKPAAYVYNFFSRWCTECVPLERRLTRLEEQYGATIQIVNVDVDTPESHTLVRKYGIESIPAIVVLNKDKSHVSTLRGLENSGQVNSLIKSMMSSRKMSARP